MKRVIIGLLCCINLLNGKVSTGKKPKHYDPRTTSVHKPKPKPVELEEVVLPHVTSKKELLKSFNELTATGYLTHLQRWVTYIWREKTEEELAQEDLEKELQEIKEAGKVAHFIDRVQGLQKKLGEVLDLMESDASHNPSVSFHTDGSIAIENEKYTFAETTFADAGREVEKLEELVLPRLITAAKERIVADPILYFSKGNNIKEVLQSFESSLNMPGIEIKPLLEELFSGKSTDDKKGSDKKLLLKLHPDRNIARKDEADKAFKNYNTLKSTYNDNKSEWNTVFSTLK